ncbi:hypothetical protein NDU88_002744 [Pleurodeles waltl]|uniref:MHC class II antigen n=1 Tax=Pleurodeles waltl TaxID=8319 RepID=A0AAV7UAK0_PLEWA|nr:hypothetical protein NDU88_002744 [Pleurodeles waltl]
MFLHCCSDVVCGGEKGDLSAVVPSETGLGGVEDVVVFEVVDQLCVDDFLYDLHREWEQGDGPDILEVSIRFFEKGNDFGVLPAFRESCCFEGDVDDFP